MYLNTAELVHWLNPCFTGSKLHSLKLLIVSVSYFTISNNIVFMCFAQLGTYLILLNSETIIKYSRTKALQRKFEKQIYEDFCL